VTALQVLAAPNPKKTSAAKHGMPLAQIDHTLNDRQQVAILGCNFDLEGNIGREETGTGAREYREYDLHVQHSP
jgi:hypothetical protein